MTRPTGFHHLDTTAPEHAWRGAITAEHRPELDLSRVERLIVLAAHPDDETLMAGGLITAAHRRGIDVDVIVATDGESSHPHSPTHRANDLVVLRRAEVVAALRELAPTATLHTLGLGDGKLALSHDLLVARIVELVGIHGPTTLLVSTWRGDGHTDHEAAALAAASAAWRTDARLLEAPIWMWHWGTPGQALPPGPVVSLSEQMMHTKRLAMEKHHSQVEPLSEQVGDEAILHPFVLAHFDRDVEVFFNGLPGEASPFDALHTAQADPWQVRSSVYEARKRALTMAALPHPTYGRVLELGCSVGALAADLAGRSDGVLAMDESIAALRRAAVTLSGRDNVQLVQLQVPEGLGRIDADLVVISEIGYFLSPGRLGRLADKLSASRCRTVVACHWRHDIRGWPLTGPTVHRILQDRLGMPRRVTINDTHFVLDVFSHDEATGP